MTTPVWRKSSWSSGSVNTDCVEVARFPSVIGIRDSKDPAGASLSISEGAFAALLARIRRAKLEL
jgi:hypothetical protein